MRACTVPSAAHASLRLRCSIPFPFPTTNLILRRNKASLEFRHGENFDSPVLCISLGFKRFFSIALSEKDKRQDFQRGSAFSSNFGGIKASDDDFIVVNFYHFVFIKNPEDEVAKHLSFMQGLDIHGRVYLNEQGINAQLEGGISHLPLLDPSMRAIPIAPSEWREKLQNRKKHGASNSELTRKFILLDVRNGYEWDIGHFHGAQRPDVDCFRTTSFGLSEAEVSSSDPLASVDKETTDILMYCTGGIRCDVYSTMLRQRGFQNLYTLKGGISHYLENEGPIEWVGNLFVFDSRLSLPPSSYKHEAVAESDGSGLVSKNITFARCHLCGSHLAELRHRNCANLDCNLLFLCCTNCVEKLQGCCSLDCSKASRLRPVLPGHQRYEKWHIYRDSQLKSSQQS
ncbi:PREDICTED: rhodanese-like domain-containing protein 8, chloroplastic isoform X2 [Nelumbo nucifera]|uniref:Rhodanese-like domain-containing protein 8, chloroplastic isoform X2 n=1 Tax=Nelumbo nucifera TaxID=4432 RepID=A0A1U8B8B0_NELNU|nr:PREDICTED: rhodanese-like domain-containing protein 8, chloroplastic isoform X2 [Nelumbo nucifera]